ncbi:MAG: hypothetical protein HW416_1997 [Chloroflexi bacterium]|nr:hypothetical protein [Chloroflexota bacterium]
MTRGSLVKAAVGFGLSVGAVFLLLRVVSLQEIGASLSTGQPLFLLPAVALYFVGTYVRSLRWRTLLAKHPVAIGLLFRTLVIGLTVNDLLPGRLGEIARAFLLARRASVPVGASLASIVVERVLDGIALTALLALGIVLAGAGGWLLFSAAFSVALFTVATGGLLWAAVMPRIPRKMGYAIVGLTPDRFRAHGRSLVDGILDGLTPIANPRTAATVLALSLLAWLIESSMYAVVMLGFHVPGGLAASLLGTAFANLATLIPSSPGYVGTFDLALQRVLTDVFSATPGEATGYTIMIHLTLLVPVVVAGLIFLWRENLSLSDLGRRHEPTAERPVAGRQRPLL